MTTITRVVDGDTFETEDSRLRVGNIDTPESVHRDSSKNTEEGKIASKFFQNVLPVGSAIDFNQTDQDNFGRKVGEVYRDINGVKIDMGLVALDQDFSQYYTDHGINPDPKIHGMYQEYYSTDVPYQFGDNSVNITREEAEEMQQKHQKFRETRQLFDDGKATQEELDSALVDLYKDPEKVVNFRRALNNWERPIEQEDPNSRRGVMRIAMESNPRLREVYNRAVRNGHLKSSHYVPEKSAWDNMTNSWKLHGFFSDAADVKKLWGSRQNKAEVELDDKELLSGAPEQFHSALLSEKNEYSVRSALVLKEQLLEDLARNKQFDDMGLLAQFGYGAAATVVNPVAWAAAVPAVRAGQTVANTGRAWQASRMILGKDPVKGAVLGSKLAGVVTGGLIEGSAVNAPRLAADHTYTPTDYTLDTIVDGAFAGVLGSAGYGVKKSYQAYTKSARESRQKLAEEIKSTLLNKDDPQVAEAVLLQPKEQVEMFEAAEHSGETIRKWTNQPIFSTQEADRVVWDDTNPLGRADTESVGTPSGEPTDMASSKPVEAVKPKSFPPFASIDKVSKEGMMTATRTLRDVYPPKSPMAKTLMKIRGLNQQDLPAEVAAEVVKLNADILHVASAFPKGTVPSDVNQNLLGVIFHQNTQRTNNALNDILLGEERSTTNATLEAYVKSLRSQPEIWDGANVSPLDSNTFIRMQSEWLNVKATDIEGDTVLRQHVPKQMSYLKDLIELNAMAIKRKDAEFTALVEELNGMATARVDQLERSELQPYTDSSKTWGVTVPMSPHEIAKQLKAEGLQPRTTEYVERMKVLRRVGIDVPEDVNRVGRLDERVIGRQIDEVSTDGEEYYTTADMKSELAQLAAKPSATKEDVQRSHFLRNRIDNKEGRVTELVAGDNEQDLLPRSFVESTTQDAFANPTVESIKRLRKQLNSNVVNKLGTKNLMSATDARNVPDVPEVTARLQKVKEWLVKDKQRVVSRMIKSGNWQSVEDVIRASKELAAEAKYKQAERPTTAKQRVVDEPVQPLTEDSLQTLIDYTSGISTKVPFKVVQQLNKQVGDAKSRMAEASLEKVNTHLKVFERSSEKKAWQLAKTPTSALDSTGRFAAKITTDLATRFQNSDINSLEYVGSRVTELGKGYGGNIRREATGGIIRDTEYKKAIMQIAPHYARAMDDYVKSLGGGAWKRFKAMWQAGADNEYVKQFDRDMFKVQELRRQGKEVVGVDESVIKFVDQWDGAFDYMHNGLVGAGISGFTKLRKVRHYIPQVWKAARLRKAIEQHGVERVIQLFEAGYRSAINNGTNTANPDSVSELAARQVRWILDRDETKPDSDMYSPVTDSRAKERLSIDTLVEIDGLSILDLLDTDVISVGTKYANRYAGWVGLAKSTDGMLTSQLDIDALGKLIQEEGKAKGIDTTAYEQYYEDLMNMMFGRPVQNGLAKELNDLKDLTVYTQMGGLGMSQLIESGTVLTKSTMMMFSSDPVVRKVFSIAREDINDAGLLSEIQAIASIGDDIEYLLRQGDHSDIMELDKINKVRQLSLWAADKATFGANKALAGRLIGKVTGANAIRKAQSRIVQASFTVDVARHFKDGKAKMSTARLADLGLVDPDGTDAELSQVFNSLVEYDANGLVSKLNFQQWPTAAQDKFKYAMLRDDAQQLQRTIVGELPTYMNKPLMALAMQFRQMPLVANNKQLARSMAFADREAVTAVMLNAAIAGMVRYSKFAALGTGAALLTNQETTEPTMNQMQVQKYMTQFGILADAVDLVSTAYKVGQSDTGVDLWDNGSDAVLQQVPVLGLMNDYYVAGKSAAQAGGAPVEVRTSETIDAAFGLMPLGNIALADMMHAWLNEQLGE